MIEIHKKHSSKQTKALGDVEHGFKQAVDMLNEKDLELAECSS